MPLTPPLPCAPALSYPLTPDDYSLIVAALRHLEADLEGGTDPEAEAIIGECQALRARLRAIRARGPALAVVVPIREAGG